MIELDTADLVVIAGRVLGLGTGAALGQLDLAAAEAALAQARAAVPAAGAAPPGRAAAATAGAALMHALLRHPPFPPYAGRLAVAAGLQFLSLNGWSAELEPPAAAAVVVEALAAGQLAPDRAAAWLAARLSPRPAPRSRPSLGRIPLPRARPQLSRPVPSRPVPSRPAGGRRLISVVLAATAGGLGIFAAACSPGPHATAAHRAHPAITRPAPRTPPARGRHGPGLDRSRPG